MNLGQRRIDFRVDLDGADAFSAAISPGTSSCCSSCIGNDRGQLSAVGIDLLTISTAVGPPAAVGACSKALVVKRKMPAVRPPAYRQACPEPGAPPAARRLAVLSFHRHSQCHRTSVPVGGHGAADLDHVATDVACFLRKQRDHVQVSIDVAHRDFHHTASAFISAADDRCNQCTLVWISVASLVASAEAAAYETSAIAQAQVVISEPCGWRSNIRKAVFFQGMDVHPLPP